MNWPVACSTQPYASTASARSPCCQGSELDPSSSLRSQGHRSTLVPAGRPERGEIRIDLVRTSSSHASMSAIHGAQATETQVLAVLDEVHVADPVRGSAASVDSPLRCASATRCRRSRAPASRLVRLAIELAGASTVPTIEVERNHLEAEMALAAKPGASLTSSKGSTMWTSAGSAGPAAAPAPPPAPGKGSRVLARTGVRHESA